ncbi:hypothetical protein HAX54_023196 [Datura stramonium]|uniref:Uncharacterized protein n=1 Tax=Datura stramonium TaxID=4076 RepID=A0ABS8UW43_DATST|nr:hypothetical protein [Datura stramonium]
MEVFAIVLIVLASVLFTTCNLLCCLCAGRGRIVKKPKLETDVEIGRTRDGNMVVLAGTGAVMTSDVKTDNNSGGAAVGGGGGTQNTGTNHGCCCGGGGCGGGGCGGCGGCGG